MYVGDEHRVQEFDPSTGEWKGEISLTSISNEPGAVITALAVNNEPASPEYGYVYLVYAGPQPTNAAESFSDNVIRKFTPAGVEVKDGDFPLTLSPRTEGAHSYGVLGMVVDSAGRLAVTQTEEVGGTLERFGVLLDGETGRLITEFAVPVPRLGGGGVGVAFGGGDELYAAVSGEQEVVVYRPVFVAELSSSPLVSCDAGAEHEADISFDCTLSGEVNPEGVASTAVWFQWGDTPGFGSDTVVQPVAAVACSSRCRLRRSLKGCVRTHGITIGWLAMTKT